jgi:hypothetical protein
MSSWWQQSTRETVNQHADLITGLPLIQVTPLELPFGGATFRLTRTKSGTRGYFSKIGDLYTDFQAEQNRLWDWAGTGWMIGESPLLLIDSALPDVVGNNPRTTYLILDAHRSIPFQLVEATGIYAAPPRFRAKLEHDGEWNPAGRIWTRPPQRYSVHLYDGRVRYHFTPVRDGMPSHFYNPSAATGVSGSFHESYHARPFLSDQFPDDGASGPSTSWDPYQSHENNPGWGFPYLGLCVKIEDSYGHKVEIEYCGVKSAGIELDETFSLDGDCVPCAQACAEFGTISRIKLSVRENVAWTLLYSYRGFRGNSVHPERQGGLSYDFESAFPSGPSGDENNWLYEALWGQYHLDRIYVYKGDVEETEGLCLRVDHRDQLLGTNGTDIEAGADPLAEHLLVAPQHTDALGDWKHVVREHYEYRRDTTNAANNGTVYNRAIKVMTSVRTRAEIDDQESIRRWVFHYAGNRVGLHQDGWPLDIGIGGYSMFSPRVTRVYDPDATERVLLEASRTAGTRYTVDAFCRIESPTQELLFAQPTPNPANQKLIDILDGHAAINFGYSTLVDDISSEWPAEVGTAELPGALGLVTAGPHGRYLTNEANRLQNDNTLDTIASVSSTDGSGDLRHFRLHRLRLLPEGGTPWDGPFHLLAGHYDQGSNSHYYEGDSHKSMFFHPYQWRGWSVAGSPAGGSQSPDLSEPRWIAIVDEFKSRGSMLAAADDPETPLVEGPYAGPSQTKPGQVSRRIVEMNAAGYVLRDRQWEFTPDGILRSGSGLGEEYIYQTIGEYFGSAVPSEPSPGTPPQPGQPGFGNSPLQDPLASFRRELLLVEYRSVGWSAGDDTQRLSEGLTRFNEYELFNPPTENGLADYIVPANTEASEETMPLSTRVQQVRRGIRRGTSYGDNGQQSTRPRLYTHELFRDPAQPGDIWAEAEYLDVTLDGDLLARASDGSPVWDPDTNPDVNVSRSVVERDNSDLSIPEHMRPVVGRMVIGPPRKLYPGSAWYYSVEREFYDEDGNMRWSATGQLRDPFEPPAQPDPYESLTFTYYHDRDDAGRSLFMIADAGTGQPKNPQTGGDLQMPAEWPDWPTDSTDQEWSRIGSTPAFNHVTAYRYDDLAPGLSDIWFPNGRRWARRVVEITTMLPAADGLSFFPHEYAIEYVFNDIVTVQGAFLPKSQCEIREYRNLSVFSSPQSTKKIVFHESFSNLDFSTPGQAPDSELYSVQSAIETSLGIDSNGRISRANLLERSPSGAMLAVGSKEVNDLGELYREQEIDGTITIQIRNSIGQPTRVYRGTEDRQWYVVDPSQYPPQNMVLVERTSYGGGINDARLPIEIWTYDRPLPFAFEPFDEIEDEDDTVGARAVVRYDWRNRAVRTDSYGPRGSLQDPPRRSTTLSYLDYLDRPRLTVVFGEDVIDPTTQAVVHALDVPPTLSPENLGLYVPGGQVTAKDVYDFGLKPLSIVENIYDIEGTLVERRTYDADWIEDTTDPDDQPVYLAEYNYVGRGGERVYAQQPEAPLEFSVLDPLGRVASTITAVPLPVTGVAASPLDHARHLTRTEFVYDPDGNVIETKQWVRVSEGPSQLNSTNAVRTRTINWYDEKNHLIATAELGTESPDNEYVYHAEVYGLYLNDNGVLSRKPPPVWNATTQTVDRGTLPETALAWVYQYDNAGNRALTVDPRGIVTEYEYSGTNRLVFKTENATGAGGTHPQMTGYRYQYGRLVEMNLVKADNRMTQIGGYTPPDLTAPANPDGSWSNAQYFGNIIVTHRSTVAYGAEIVRPVPDGDGWWTYYVISEAPELVGKLHLPDPTTGEPNGDWDIYLRYTYSGQVAERFTANGLAFRYFYDDQSRVRYIEVGQWSIQDGYPTWYATAYPIPFPGSLGSAPPPDRVGFVEYIYDERGNTAEVVAYDERGGTVLTRTTMAYERDRLATEWQGIGANDPGARIDYLWSYLPTNPAVTDPALIQPGRHRLSSIEYPVPDASLNRRLLTIQYGAAGSTDDLLSRVAGLHSSFGTAQVASLSYAGDGRRKGLSLASNKIQQSFAVGSEVGLARLDRFGRNADLLYRNTASTTLYRAVYDYDEVGNRIAARITQAPVAGSPRDNVRSVVNGYDSLNRLVRSEVGQLSGPHTSGEKYRIEPGTGVHQDLWQLDALGNWSGLHDTGTGQLVTPGRRTTGNLDGYGTPWALPGATAGADGQSLTDAVNGRDAIDQRGFLQIEYDTAGQVVSETPSDIDPVHDAAGNMIFDGRYAYQYDAWGRLVQINEAEADAQSPQGFQAGAFVRHFLYDGLGRMVRATSAYPEPDMESTQTRSVRYYYDGARCIQEVLTDPVLNMETAQASGDPNLQLAADGSTSTPGTDGKSTPAGMENSLVEGGLNPTPLHRNIHREYVWGPGDNGFDEIWLQADHLDNEWWTLQDAGGDVVATVRVRPSDGLALIKQQYTYDAYGAVLSAEDISAPGLSFQSHIGHKGLPVDRLDAPAGDNDTQPPRLIPFAHTLSQNRNRTYHPFMGRFLQMDPNQTALAMLSVAAMHGRGFGSLALAFDLGGLHGDGLNLYQYLGSNPWNRSDPLGLSYDPFAEVEAIIDEIVGHRAGVLSALGQEMAATALVAARIMSMLPIPMAGIAGDLALYALGDQSAGATVAAIALGVVPGGKLLGKAGQALFKSIGGLGSAAWGTAKALAAKGGSFLRKQGHGLVERARSFLNSARKTVLRVAGCGCFTASTVVWTAQGALPISEIQVGQPIYAAAEAGQAWEYAEANVGTTIFVGTASLVKLTVRHEDGSVEVISTTDEHPFHAVHTEEWTRADALVIGDLLSTMTGAAELLAVQYGSEQVPVYNLSIPGSPTYYVGTHGVWVHNAGGLCGPFPVSTKTYRVSRSDQNDWVKGRAQILLKEYGDSDVGKDIARRTLEGQILNAGGDLSAFSSLISQLFKP